MSPKPNAAQGAWFVTRRTSELEGEMRAAVLRILLVTVLYAIQLGHHFFFSQQSEGDLQFQRQATIIAAGWLCVSLIVMLAVRRRWFPPTLKYFSSGCDIVLLTITAMLGSGPASPLVIAFGLVIAMAGLRISTGLIWFSTIGCMMGYMLLVARIDPVWFDEQHVTAPVAQGVTLVSLLALGVTLVQLVGLGRRAVEQYAGHLAQARNRGPGLMNKQPTESETVAATRRCISCGAACDPRTPTCWLCYANQEQNPYTTGIGTAGREATYQVAEIPHANLVSAADDPAIKRAFSITDWCFAGLLAGCVLLTLLVGVGIGIDDPSALWGFAVLVAPAYAITGVRGMLDIGNHGTPRPVRLFTTFMVSFVATVSVLLLLAVAGILLLVVLCFGAISGQN